MKRILSVLAVLGMVAVGLFSASVPAAVAASGGDPGAPDLTDRYIVVFNDGTDAQRGARDHARKFGAEVSHVYDAVLDGYAAKIRGTAIAAVRSDPRVKYVERDGLATAAHHACGHVHPRHGEGDCGPTTTAPTTTTTTTTLPPGCTQSLPWGIDRVDADQASVAAGDCAGAVGGVTVYVIDTGVATHPDINKVGHVNHTGDGINDDCDGHGTHVAGTAAGIDNTFGVVGVLPGAPVVGVKVLNCSGSGTWSGVIAGINWVKNNAAGPAVANMSLGGGYSASVNSAVIALADSGVPVAVAAGNSSADACNYSPASAGTHGGVITVGSTTSSDQKSSFSNDGACVDIWAPGSSIYSTFLSGYATLSGTSMASPHVAGGAGLALLAGSASAAAAEADLVAAAEPVTYEYGPRKRPRTASFDLLDVGGF